MKKINPYEVLGVDPGANDAAVKAAYRRESKSLHPDAGGSAQAFEELSRCRDLLLDPVRRQRYDETGEFEASEPNNDRASAMTIIVSHVQRMIDDFVRSGFDPRTDPTRQDIVVEIDAAIQKAVSSARQSLVDARKHRKAVDKFQKRLKRKKGAKGEDFLSLTLAQDMRRIDAGIAGIEEGIRVAELARTIVNEYGFDVDTSVTDGTAWPSPPFTSRDFIIGFRG